MIHLNNHQAIIIQGPIEHGAPHIAKFYSQFDKVVWSTWDDTPDELLQAAQSLGVNILLNRKPKFNGYLNVNYQFYSTFAGIKHVMDTYPSVTEILKVRSDVILFGVERLLNRVSGSDISFMYMYNKLANRALSYYLNYWHIGMDFPADFIIHGNINAMYHIFNFQMEYFSEIPPESIILRNYLNYRGFDNNFDFEYLKSIGVMFFSQYAQSDNFYTLSTKYGYDILKKPPAAIIYENY